MFTGMIDHQAKVVEVAQNESGCCLVFQSKFKELKLGESIAVDGICLTVAAVLPSGFAVDVSPESLSVTIAGGYVVGSKANVERALLAADRLGGHWVSGHIDQVAALSECQTQGDYRTLRFSGVASESLKYFIPKGSVTVNGVSLTINRVLEAGFEVMLVPHTWAMTNLASLHNGDRVNVEFDMIAKLVARQLEGKDWILRAQARR